MRHIFDITDLSNTSQSYSIASDCSSEATYMCHIFDITDLSNTSQS